MQPWKILCFTDAPLPVFCRLVDASKIKSTIKKKSTSYCYSVHFCCEQAFMIIKATALLCNTVV